MSDFFSAVKDAKTRITEINAQDVKTRQSEDKNVILLDVRDAREWNKGSIEGAKHCSLSDLTNNIKSIISDTSTPIIAFCGGGLRSALAADTLQDMGYENVVSLAGGIKAYDRIS